MKKVCKLINFDLSLSFDIVKRKRETKSTTRSSSEDQNQHTDHESKITQTFFSHMTHPRDKTMLRGLLKCDGCGKL